MVRFAGARRAADAVRAALAGGDRDGRRRRRVDLDASGGCRPGWSARASAPTTPRADRLHAVLASDVPVLVDADGLTLLAEHAEDVVRARTAPTVLTPHAGEFARLSGPGDDVEADRLRHASGAAETRRHGPAQGLTTDRARSCRRGDDPVARAPGSPHGGVYAVNPPATAGWPPPAPATCWPARSAALLAAGLEPLDAALVRCVAARRGRRARVQRRPDLGERVAGAARSCVAALLGDALEGRLGPMSIDQPGAGGPRARAVIDLDAISANVGVAARSVAGAAR